MAAYSLSKGIREKTMMLHAPVSIQKKKSN